MGKPKNIPEEMGNEMCQRYLAGESANKVGKHYGVCHTTVYKQLKKRGLSIRSNRALFTEEQVKDICLKYERGVSTQKLGPLYNVVPSTITRILLKNKIYYRSTSERSREFTLNHSIFRELTPEVAYWIGFIAADGCVHKKAGNSFVITIALQIADSNHVEKFKKFLEATQQTKIWRRGTVAGIHVTSSEIAKDLLKYGITPRKSLTMCIHNCLEDNRDFWRGVCDGDGSLGLNPIRLQMSGSYNLMGQFRNYIHKHITTAAEVHKRGNIGGFSLSGVLAKEAIRILYANSVVSLDRKQCLADRILNEDFKTLNRRYKRA